MHRMRTIALSLGLLAALALVATAGAAHSSGPAGHVYVLSNSPAGNAVLDYSRAADGTLSGPVSYPTGGTGTGGGLGSQGAVILDGDDLYAVNAGSNSITRFSVQEGRPRVGGDRALRRHDADQPHRQRPPALRPERRRTDEHHRLRHARRRPDADPRLDPRDGPGRHRPGADLVQPQRPRARRDREDDELDRDLLRRQRRARQRRRLLRHRRHAVRLRLRQARQPPHLERVRLGLVLQPQPRGPRKRDQRRRADLPGRAVLARHEQGRPLRLHRERRPRHDLGLHDRRRRHASPCSHPAAPPPPSAPARTRPTRRSRRTASSTTSPTGSTASPASRSPTTAASRTPASSPACRSAPPASPPASRTPETHRCEGTGSGRCLSRE